MTRRGQPNCARPRSRPFDTPCEKERHGRKLFRGRTEVGPNGKDAGNASKVAFGSPFEAKRRIEALDRVEEPRMRGVLGFTRHVRSPYERRASRRTRSCSRPVIYTPTQKKSPRSRVDGTDGGE